MAVPSWITELMTKITAAFIQKSDAVEAETMDTAEVTTLDIDTTPASGSNHLITSGGVYSFAEAKGKITIGGTQYNVRTSTTDAGAAGYITFVTES